jgi:hypothetical protein
MAAPAGIDYDWAVRTDGRLTMAQSRAMLKPLTKVVLAYPGQRMRIARKKRGSGGVDLDTLVIPDSRLAKEAEAEVRETASPAIQEHSFRTFYYGMSLAAIDGVQVDVEMAYVSSLLHDLTLGQPVPKRCFALTGAERAEKFCLDREADPAFARRVAEEICGHITAGAMADIDTPGGFVQAGAFLDLAGGRLDELDPDWVAEVIRRHPRNECKKNVCAAWKAETKAVPKGRSKWLARYAMFPLLIKIAPYDE